MLFASTQALYWHEGADERSAELQLALEQTQPAELAAVLQLAANMTGHFKQPAKLLFQQLGDMGEWYMQAAAEGAAVDNPTGHPSQEQQQKAAKLQHAQQLWQLLPVEQLMNTAILRGSMGILSDLAVLPTADSVSVEVLSNQLEAAVQRGDCNTLLEIQWFPMFTQISEVFVADLMLQSLRRADDDVATALAVYPQVEQFSADVVIAAVQTSLQTLNWATNTRDKPWSALRLPGLQQLDAAAAAGLLRAALQHRPPCSCRRELNPPIDVNPFCVLLRSLPAAGEMTPEDYVDLVAAALQQADHVYASLLLNRPAAWELEAEQIAQLMRIVLDLKYAGRQLHRAYGQEPGPWYETLRLLRNLQHARDISTDAISDLLTSPVPDVIASHLLLQLDGSVGLGQDFVRNWLQLAVYTADAALVNLLCGLPAAGGLDFGFVAGLIMKALAVGSHKVAVHLLQRLGCGVQVEKPEEVAQHLYPIIRVLVRRSTADKTAIELLSMICQSRWAYLLTDGHIVGGIMREALKVGHMWTMNCLLELLGASAMDAALVGDLLGLCLELPEQALPCAKVFKRLCGLPGASNLGPARIEELLCTAIDRQSAVGRGIGYEHCRSHSWGGNTDIIDTIEGQAAQHIVWDAVIEQLCNCCNLTAGCAHVDQLLPEALGRLLQQAVVQQNARAVVSLCAVPAAQHVAAAVLTQLVTAAIQSKLCVDPKRLYRRDWAAKAVQALLGLQQVQQLDASSIQGLLQLAVQHDHRCAFVDGLLGLPAAQRLGKDALAQVMATASAHGSASAMQTLMTWRK